MSEMFTNNNFEQKYDNQLEYERGVRAAGIALELGKAAMHFSSVERVPRYANGERENDAEHSFMLALVAPEIAIALELPLDIGLVSQFATVHDLIELKTGDIATYLFTEDDQLQKEAAEHEALLELIEELPNHTTGMLLRYEAQNEPESRFVRYIDKLLPMAIDIVGAGKKIMCEDYNVTTVEQLRRADSELINRFEKKFDGEFPEIDLAHRLLCELFESKFDEMI